MNPNNAKLTFCDPRYGKILLDSQEVYEYVEQRYKEIKRDDVSGKPELILSES